MPYLRAQINNKLADYVDSKIDNILIKNRTDAITQIIINDMNKNKPIK